VSERQFEVVARSKTEKTVKGKKQVIYKVTLKTSDSLNTLTLSDTDAAIIERYPLDAEINVKIGKSPQTNLAPKA
jgi:hypothetical protein